jgi:predicted ABC-type ATPase
MERLSIKLDRIEVGDFLRDWEGKSPKNLKLVNVRGCNGAGKSSVPLQMLRQDRATFIFTINGKEVATCFPNFKYLAMGKYRTKTGGLDGFKTNEETREVLEKLWTLPFNILMEGVISSTIFSTYAEMFKNLKNKHPNREIIVANFLPPLKTCLERVKKRNGGKEIDEKAVESKYNTVSRNADKFRLEDIKSLKLDNSEIALDETVGWFLSSVK